MMLMFVCWKDYQNTCAISGWTEIPDPEFADGTVGEGSGLGSVKVACFYKEHDGSESNPNIDFTSITTNVAGNVMIVFRKDSGETWETPAYATAAIALATNWTATGSSDPGGTGGDVLVNLVCFRDNSGTQTRGTDGIDWDGITWAEDYQQQPAAEFETSAGPDLSADLGYRTLGSGTSTAAPTAAGTLGSDETGASLWVRLRVSGGGGGGGNRRRRFFMAAR